MNTKEKLLQKDIKPSLQRMMILDKLYEDMGHMSVDEIYSALKDTIPTLSKSTVYNTLQLFVEHNLVSEVTIDNTMSMYEVAQDFHGHFQCVKCNKIFDIEVSDDFIDVGDNIVLQKDVYLKGICKNCQNKA